VSTLAATDPSGTDSGANGFVRAYVITGGRTRVNEAPLAFEALVCATDRGTQQRSLLMFERKRIVELAASPVSVAELAAHLPVPIGVAQVLAADLAADGLLDVSSSPSSPATDVALIKRLIDGVRAL
jgi:Protein of unknown function (DUF742)